VGLWFLTPLSTTFLLYHGGQLYRGGQLYHGGQFIGGGNRSAQRKPPTCRKSLTNEVRIHNFSGARH